MRANAVNRTEDYYKNMRDVHEGIDGELTVSHVLRHENSFTERGKPFGRILAEKIRLPENPDILEVGPGLGDVAREICGSLPDYTYTFIDISPDFIKNLQRDFPAGRHSFIVGDFLKEKITGKFDLIICNEVLADLPTIANMSLGGHGVQEENRETYYDAVSLVKFYGIKVPKGYNFNYGAVKFLEKAKSLLKDNGKIFVSEHASSPPKHLRVYGHSEYTIDFQVLDKVAKRLKFSVNKGTLTGLMGIKKKRAILFYTQPELKMLYTFFKRQGVYLDQKPYTPEEILKLLSDQNVSFYRPKEYLKFLRKHEEPLKKITDQFRYMILRKKQA